MLFDSTSQSLFTDQGELIKVLHCPLKKLWQELQPTDTPHRTCSNCERAVLDTSTLTEAEVVAMVRNDPETCLAVSTIQENLTVLPPRSRHFHPAE